MSKLLKPLRRSQCAGCGDYTLVRDRFMFEAQPIAQVCVKCVPVDSKDMTQAVDDLVIAGS